MKQYVAYLRVSTQEQKKSGLGIEAQREIIRHYASLENVLVTKEYIEAESGKETLNRPVLREAMTYCQAHDCVLVVAKLDRLSRDVEHIFHLQKQLGERLRSCDLPSSDSLTLSIFAGLAQREREIISIRTRQALKAKKEQGAILGKPENFSHAGRLAGASMMKAKALLHPSNTRATKLIEYCKTKGMSFGDIAKELNENGFKTVNGKTYQRATVKMLWDRSQKSQVTGVSE
jgi:DNA invertase Pin-like site-specific DNA recombinase